MKKILLLALCALVFSAYAQGPNCTVVETTHAKNFEYRGHVLADTNNDGTLNYNIMLGRTDEDGNDAVRYVNLLTGAVDYQFSIPNRGGVDDYTKPLGITADANGIWISAETGVGSASSFAEFKYLPFFSGVFEPSKNKTIYGVDITNLSYIAGNVYMILSVDINNYDPLDSGWTLPINSNGPNVQRILLQVDGNTADKVWAKNLEGYIDISKKIVLSNGNLAINTALPNGKSSFNEYNSTNGDFVQTLLSSENSSSDNLYSFSQGHIFHFDKGNNKTSKYDTNFVLQDATVSDGRANFTRELQAIREFPDGTIIGANAYSIIFYENNLVHKFVERPLGMDGYPHVVIINDDKSVTFINRVDNGNGIGVDEDVKIYKVTVTEDLGRIPSIDVNADPNIVEFYPGKKPGTNSNGSLDGSLVDVGNYEATLTFTAGNLPAVDSKLPTSIIHANGNMTAWLSLKVVEVNGIRQFRVLARNPNYLLDIYSLTVYCVESTDDDNDGVLNTVDQCPDTPSGETVDANGCSNSQLDDDNDGVMNNVDICPNTPTGVTVNIAGCFVLPSNNFKVQTISETCVNSNNGKLIISSEENHNYTTTINGNSYTFTSSLTVANLPPNQYNFCISVAGTNYEQCFNIKIAAGVSISGKLSTTSKKASIQITKGTAPYKVFVNGLEALSTYNSSFKINVHNNDVVEVKTSKPCEGVFLKNITLLNKVIAFPNPTKGLFKVSVPTKQKNVYLEIYNLNGQLVIGKNYPVTEGKILLNIENQPKGVYLIHVFLEASKNNFTTKIVKK